MKTTWIFGVTSALALGGVAAHGLWRAHAGEAENAKQRAALAEVREELARLTREQDASEAALQTARAVSRAAAAQAQRAHGATEPHESPAVEEPLPEMSDLDPREEAKAHRLELQDSLEATFTTQSYDAGWAHGAQERAEELVRVSLPAGSALRAVDCRETLCRVELDHQDVDSHREFVGHFDEAMQWGGPAAILFDETVPGKVATIAYLGRKDVPFPDAEPTL